MMSGRGGKRKREDEADPAAADEDVDGYGGGEDHKLDEAEIAALLDTAPEVEALTPQALRRLVLNLEKRYTKNQEMRVKYPDQPEKFLDSEVDLDEGIKELHVLATAPNLYLDFVKLNAVRTLVTLLQHENNDIVVDVINLIYELTQPNETVSEAEEEEGDSLIFPQTFVEQEGGLEVLLSNLERLDESVDEEKQAVYNLMGILENLSEVMPETGTRAMKNDIFRPWVLRRIKAEGFDDNKGYAAEVVSIFLQNSPESRKVFADADGIDTLLVSLAPYRKLDPPSPDEEEYVENLFNSLCTCLITQESKETFGKSQGFELMLIMIKSKKFSRKSALKVVDFALAGHEVNCKYFVEILGLKTLFAAFMKKGAKKKNRKGFNELADDEHIAASIASLFKSLMDEGGEPYTRLLNKFKENNYQKIERLLELHAKYSKKAAAYDQQIDEEKAARRASGEELTDMDEEYYLSLRLDEGHLFTLQLLDYIIAAVATSPLEGANAYIKQLLKQQGGSLEKVKEVLTSYEKSIGSSNPDEATSEEVEKEKANIRQLIERLQ